MGFGLNAILPPHPRFELRGAADERIAAVLSADGTILTTASMIPDANGESLGFTSLRTWDTSTGRMRGEFLRGLIGKGEIRGRDDLDARGFTFSQLVCSPDKRYCALPHRDGLALADLQTGQEWSRVVAFEPADYSQESVDSYRMLQTQIETAGLQNEMPLTDALKKLSNIFEGKLKFTFADDFVAANAGPENLDPRRTMVVLPPVPTRMSAQTALRLLLSQVGTGGVDYLIRPGVVEITTSRSTREYKVGWPRFSPRGSFVALMEWGKRGKSHLHIVECASGQVVAALPADPEYNLEDSAFSFSPDEEFLSYWADKDDKPIFTVWDVRRKQKAREFETISALGKFTPDGHSLVASNCAGEWQLVNLRTGEIRALPGLTNKRTRLTITPDGQTLVCPSDQGMELWDMPTCKKRGCAKMGQRWWVLDSPIFLSADSGVVCEISDIGGRQFTAWSVNTGERLWPPIEPEAVNAGKNQNEIEVFYFGKRSRADMSPKFTPDLRFLCDMKKDRINLLDPATGEVSGSLKMDGHANNPAILAFTPDGRFMLSRWDTVARKPWFGVEWIEKWRPAPTQCFIVSNVTSGDVLLRVNNAGAHAVLSDDGRTLMTHEYEENVPVVRCWDVPGRPSRLLIAYFLVGLGIGSVAIIWWVKRRMRPQKSVPVVS